jgi:hypothetical protein
MRKLDDLLEAAKQLPASERRRLIEQLEEGLPGADAEEPDAACVAAMERWVGLAGSGHSDHTDVSSEKYGHLAAIYSDER